MTVAITFRVLPGWMVILPSVPEMIPLEKQNITMINVNKDEY